MKTDKEIQAEKMLADIVATHELHHLSSYNKPGFVFEKVTPKHLGVYAYAGDGDEPDRWSMRVGIHVPGACANFANHAQGWYAYIGPIPDIAKTSDVQTEPNERKHDG